MGSHSLMMHYASHERKCLSHHLLRYRPEMATANERLRKVREKRYATAVEAAKAMGVKEPTYIQHENGIRGTGSIPRKAAERYAAFFRVSLDWLLTGRGDDADEEPSEAELEQMLREVIDGELTMETRIADLPRIVAPGLRLQLELFRSDRAGKGKGQATAPDKAAPTLAATIASDREESRTT